MPVIPRRVRIPTAAPQPRTRPVTSILARTMLHLNPDHPRVVEDLAAPTQLHRTLMDLLPDGLGPHPRQAAGLLYHHDRTRDGEPRLLIQVWMPLDLTRLPAGYARHVGTEPLAPRLGRLRTGQRIRYRITANTCTLEPSPDHPRGRTVGLTGTAALTWWHTRATHAGLALHQATATPVRFPRPNRDAPYHQLTRFDGTATVTCPDALTWAVQFGIGKARTYGAGLLLVATDQ